MDLGQGLDFDLELRLVNFVNLANWTTLPELACDFPSKGRPFQFYSVLLLPLYF